MSDAQIDYVAVFRQLPVPVLLLAPDLVMLAANHAYEEISGRAEDELVGLSVFTAFPDNPAEPAATGTRNLGDSLRRVLETRERDVMALQRYDVEVPGSPGVFLERYWCPLNVPVKGPGGEVTMIMHVVEEVSDLIRKFVEAEAAGT